MAYKIFYIDDLETDSRKKDLEDLGYSVKLYDPTSNLNDLFIEIEEDTDAVILDYRLTKGANHACFDAPTIAQTLRTKHKDDNKGIPLILMSNEIIKVNEFDKDFTSQDLFDFVLTKEDFTRGMKSFKSKLDSFIGAYQKIKTEKNLITILGLEEGDISLHSRFISAFDKPGNDQLKISSLIYDNLICAIGLTVGEDVLSSRLGVSKTSEDWSKLMESLGNASYKGIFSDIKKRWWMEKVNSWWKENISDTIPIRRLNAEERVNLIAEKTGFKNLIVVEKTTHSESTNFWTICKYSKRPIDPFDGVELLKEYLPWQEKEYLSIDSALLNKDVYQKLMSNIDKKAMRELASKLNGNE
ncbi:hypothetical protein G7A72_16480 [Flavobacterium sp. Sr18]|uniref:hypothetical protein n=1 Tax=Flavobacterium sp. Sr18 TaxID=935222 RepID=UPI0013E44F90|nr:hypothetical protein [Flavobacterium sp. Sr18]QIH40307.1 hypothetical protein G7A72_16480 [Flavobacterium sp. Sr18]